MKRFFTPVRAAIAIALLLYLALSGSIQWTALAGLWVVWPATLAALLLLMVDHVVTAWRLCVLMRPRGLTLTLGASTRLNLMGIFFNTCLPGALGGDVVRIYYAAENNRGRRAEVITVMMLDRALGMLALVTWPLMLALILPGLVGASTTLHSLLWFSTALAAAMVAVMLAGSSRRVRSSRIVGWAFRHLPLGSHLDSVLSTIQAYRRDMGTLLAAFAISLLAHTLAMIVTLAVAWAMHPSQFTAQMALLLPLGFLANSLPLTPGGLGVGEAAFDTLFGMAGLDGGAEVLLGWRLLNFLTGLIGLGFYLQGHRRFVHDAAVSGMQQELSLP